MWAAFFLTFIVDDSQRSTTNDLHFAVAARTRDLHSTPHETQAGFSTYSCFDAMIMNLLGDVSGDPAATGSRFAETSFLSKDKAIISSSSRAGNNISFLTSHCVRNIIG